MISDRPPSAPAAAVVVAVAVAAVAAADEAGTPAVAVEAPVVVDDSVVTT